MSSEIESHDRLPSLDCVRGVAILLVLMCHLLVFSGVSPSIAIKGGKWLDGGYFGVDLFFALSGFLITRGLIESWSIHRTISPARFYWKRATRLLPALFTMLACITIALVLIGDTLASVVPTVRSAALFVSNFQGDIGWGAPRIEFAHLWSLAVEEQFYLVWPNVLLGLLRVPPRWALGALSATVLAVLLWRMRHAAPPEVFPMWRTDIRVDTLILGSMGAFVHHYWVLTKRWALVATVVGATVFFAHVVCAGPLVPYVQRIGLLPIGASATAMVWGLAELDRRGTPLVRSRLLSIPGRYSYSIYLWHFPVFYLVSRHSHGLGIGIVMPASFAIVAIFVACSWVLVERPALRLRRILN